jgi:hypothetical protein
MMDHGCVEVETDLAYRRCVQNGLVGVVGVGVAMLIAV